MVRKISWSTWFYIVSTTTGIVFSWTYIGNRAKSVQPSHGREKNMGKLSRHYKVWWLPMRRMHQLKLKASDWQKEDNKKHDWDYDRNTNLKTWVNMWLAIWRVYSNSLHRPQTSFFVNKSYWYHQKSFSNKLCIKKHFIIRSCLIMEMLLFQQRGSQVLSFNLGWWLLYINGKYVQDGCRIIGSPVGSNV